MTYIFYNNKRWVKDNKNGYYHAHFGKTTKLLHRQIWEDNYGEIPKGYHIHHIDENKDNNTIDNLELLSMHEHLRNHFLNNVKNGILNLDESLEKARVKAKEWHSSEEGKKWHSIHAKEIANKIPYVTKKCEYCGNEYKVKKSYAYKSKFCSNKCKSANRRHNRLDDVAIKCKVCGNIFYSNKYDNAVVCSTKCRSIYNSENKKNNK